MFCFPSCRVVNFEFSSFPCPLFDVIRQPSSSLLHSFAKTSPIFLHWLSMPSLSIPVTSYLHPQFMVLAKSLPLRFRLLFHSSIPPCISHFYWCNLASLTKSIPILSTILRRLYPVSSCSATCSIHYLSIIVASPGFIVGLFGLFFVLCSENGSHEVARL